MKAFPSPKINLGLSVLRKRADGYHDIETLFVPYTGVCDELEIVTADKTSIEIEGADWDPFKDLTMKAYELLSSDFDLAPVAIRLRKNIPVGAGLGGGSADAVAALKLLNELFSLGLSVEALEKYASRLGSDCPFFVRYRQTLACGRGEIFEPFEVNLDPYEIRVEMPVGVHVSTAEAYGGIIPRESPLALGGLLPLREALSLPVGRWKDALVNDFESTVFRTHPEIPALKQRLYDEGAVYAAMSGSGASVFGLFNKSGSGAKHCV